MMDELGNGVYYTEYELEWPTLFMSNQRNCSCKNWMATIEVGMGHLFVTSYGGHFNQTWHIDF